MCARNAAYLDELAAEISGTHAYPYDVCDTAAASGVFSRIRQDLGPVAVLVYNAGSGEFVTIDNTSLEMLQQAWEINTRGLFVTAQEVLPDMRQAGGGNIVVSGATASLRGEQVRLRLPQPRPPSGVWPNPWRATLGRKNSCIICGHRRDD